MRKKNTRLKRKRRTIVFNVDVAKRRRSGTPSKRKAVSGGWRWGRPALAGVVILVLCVCAAVILGIGFLKPSGFTVRWIEVRNEESLSEERVKALAGIKAGDNLFSADLQRIRARICAHPDVRDAVVKRRMPGKVAIRVYERYPIAAMYCPVRGVSRQSISSAKTGASPRVFQGDRMRRYVVDADGIILSAKKERNSRTLPLLLGLKLGTVKPGDRLCSRGAKNALGIVGHYRNSELCRQLELVSVDASDPDNYLIKSNVIQEIRLGSDNLDERLRLLSFILKQRKYRGIDGPASYIDLRWKDVAELPLVKEIVAKK
ncbi:MAG: FtsQ-type POTRA domain-containing protein [bacterium]